MGKPTLENLKFKVASQVGVNLSQGYNGEITTKQAGLVGGNMVKELITRAEQNLSTTYPMPPNTTFTAQNFVNNNWV